MAASAGKLAAALHRRTRRVTSALAYAALEWVLIALLLINGLLAYAIARFADYFGLNPPCLLCSRVDRLFQAEAGDAVGAAPWLRDALCGDHAAEISALGYCLRHRRLAEAGEMCDGCRSSWKQKTSGAGACTCCKAVVRTSLREGEDTITRDEHVLEKINEEVEDGDQGYVLLAQDDHEEDEEEEPGEVENQEQELQSEVEGQQQEDEVMAAVQDESLEFMDQVQDITIEDDRLVSVVALDEMTIADDSGLHRDVEEENGMNRVEDEQDSRDVDIGEVLEEKRMLDSSVATPADVIEDSVELISPVPCPETLTDPSHPDHNSISQDDVDVPEDTAEIGDSTAEEENISVPQVSEAVSEDDNRTTEVDTNCEVSIGSDICEREQDDHVVLFQDLAAFEEPVAPLAAADDLSLSSEILEPPDQGKIRRKGLYQ